MSQSLRQVVFDQVARCASLGRLRFEAEAQLSACRTLASKLPAAFLSPADSANLAQLVLVWLSLPTQRPAAAAAAAGSSASAPALQLQRESLGLLLWLARDGRTQPQLQSAAAKQLLQQLGALYTAPATPPAAGHAVAALHDAGRAEVLCCAADVLGALPQLTHPAARQQIAVQGLDVLVRALEGMTRGIGAQRDAARASATVLVKLLKAFQALLAEAKRDHGCNLGALIPSLQRLLSFGLHDQPAASPLQRGHPNSATYPATGAGLIGAAAGSATCQSPVMEQQPGPPVQSCPAAALDSPQRAASGQEGQLACMGGAGPSQGRSYVPPHLRRATAPAEQPAADGGGSSGGGNGGRDSTVAAPQQGMAVGPPRNMPQQQRRLSDTGPALPSATGSSPAVTDGKGWGRSSSSTGGGSAAGGSLGSGSSSRQSSTGSGSTRDAAGSPQRRSTAGAARSRRQSGLDSSDSEVSDSEGPGVAGARTSRVRLGVLAVLQALAKADPKALHPSWTTLLPTSDSVLSPAPSPAETTLAHMLLHDPVPKVRQAAAVTVATLLEGPAQRAYLGIAECSAAWERQPVRGFLSLSLSLGLMAVALHTSLLHVLHAESDPAVVLCALRALGMLLLGAPYHRLPPALLPRCVQSFQASLEKAALPGSPRSPARLASPLPQDVATLAAACLSCLAAALGTRQPSPALASYLQGHGSSTSTNGRASSSSSPSGGSHTRGLNATAIGAESASPVAAGIAVAQRQALTGTGQALVQLLFSFAACGTAGVELEAVMALRGLAQQYCGALEGQWDRVARVAEEGAGVAVQMVPPSPRSQQDGTLAEKLAHQSIRLAGDFLAATDPQAAAPSSIHWPDPQQHVFSLPPRRQGSAGWRESQQTPKACQSSATPAVVRPAPGPPREAEVVQESTTELAGLPKEQQQQHAKRWTALAQGTLGPAMAHSSPLVRSAVYAVVAGLSPCAYAALPAPLQQQLLQWACSGATQEEGSPVRAAAVKAAGALAASPCILALHKGPELLLAALQGSCRDTVLAVRAQAAPALAAFCRTLEATLSRLGPAALPAKEGGAAGQQQHAYTQVEALINRSSSSSNLHRGKACSYIFPVPAGQLSDPADSSLRTELESSLVLALLHLLSLVPRVNMGAEAPADGPACERADLLQAMAALAVGTDSTLTAGWPAPLQQYWTQLCSLVGAALREFHAGGPLRVQNYEPQYCAEFGLSEAAVALAPGPQALLATEGWLGYDADLLDSPARRRKRSTADAMSTELVSKLQVISQGSTDSSSACGVPVATGPADVYGQPESMQFSAECSPAPTPQRSGGGASSTPCSSGRVGGSMQPPPSARLPHCKAVQLNEQVPTSPSDPQLEGIDLRKATLMRLMMIRAGSGEDVEMASQGSPARFAHQPSAAWRPGHSLFGSPIKPIASLRSMSEAQPPEPGGSPCSMESSPVGPGSYLPGHTQQQRQQQERQAQHFEQGGRLHSLAPVAFPQLLSDPT
ncbi:hypothetical protein N2152v2_002115 [Parachlorella kessleri]